MGLKSRVAFSLAMALFCAAPVPAVAGVVYRIDPGFTRISFSVDNLGGLFSTTGQFKAFEGRLFLDMDNPANAEVDVSAHSASVATGWGAADEMLNSADYLDPKHFPDIHFVSSRVEVQATDHALLHGRLTMRGVTRDQTFEAVLQGRHVDAVQGPLADYVVVGKVNRGDFGMVADHPLVGEEITIRISAHIRLNPVR